MAMTPGTRLGGAILLCAASAVAACATVAVREARVVELPAVSIEAAPPKPGDYAAAFAAIAAVFERRLELPRPDVRLLLFPDRRSFEAGLVAAGNPADAAKRIANSFQAVGTARGVLANEGSFDGMSWRSRVQLVAHELVHCVQYQLGGGRRGTSEQWLREGFAELVSLRAVEHLDLGEAAELRLEWRQRLADTLRADAVAPPGHVPLARLSTFADWTSAQARYGLPIYLQALVAAESLVEQHGAAAVARYFTLFAASEDREANFQRAFGRSLSDFDRQFGARWQAELAQVIALRED
jgi:hypothetical protein